MADNVEKDNQCQEWKLRCRAAAVTLLACGVGPSFLVGNRALASSIITCHAVCKGCVPTSRTIEECCRLEVVMYSPEMAQQTHGGGKSINLFRCHRPPLHLLSWVELLFFLVYNHV